MEAEHSEKIGGAVSSSQSEALPELGHIPGNCRVDNSSFGRYTEIGEENRIENSSIGDYSYTSPYCFFQNTVIGKFSSVAAMVRVGPTAHPMERVSLHHFTYRRKKYGFAARDDEAFFSRRAEQVTRIGNDTWIGHGAIIMPGLCIGDGAVIGAAAVVTKDVPDYGIVVGTPARLLRKRFGDEQIEELKQIAWWDWSYEELKSRLEDFSLPVEAFIEKYRGRG